MGDTHRDENLRRSLVMAAADQPATALTNGQAAEIISRLQTEQARFDALLATIERLLREHHDADADGENGILRSGLVELLANARR